MEYIKPITEKLKSLFSVRVTDSTVKPSRKHYLVGIVIDVICLVILFSVIKQPISHFISPLASSFKSLEVFANSKNTYDTFAFAPGWTIGKLGKVDFTRLSTLAYFDIPVDSDGTLIRDTDGYAIFTSEQAAELFKQAHLHGTKVVLTITQVDNSEILAILDSPVAQQTLINETIAEVSSADIDGVNVDFEFRGRAPQTYRNKFSNFITHFRQQMHERIPGSLVSVSLADNITDNSLYGIKSLSTASDRVFIMAYDFPAPESRAGISAAPLYGYDKNEYWKKVFSSINKFLPYIESNKLSIETAWYGNGDNYPTYESNNASAKTPSHNSLKTPLDPATIEGLIAEVPAGAKHAARKNLPLIAKALEDEGILSSNVLAYALATIEHETAGTFEPLDEFKGRKSARRLGYEGGTNYFGRGFIQLTHLRNYKKVGARIGVGDKLVKTPELAGDPKIAAKVLAAFFKDNGIAELAGNGNFVAARRPINPDYQGGFIAELAYKYLYILG